LIDEHLLVKVSNVFLLKLSQTIIDFLRLFLAFFCLQVNFVSFYKIEEQRYYWVKGIIFNLGLCEWAKNKIDPKSFSNQAFVSLTVISHLVTDCWKRSKHEIYNVRHIQVIFVSIFLSKEFTCCNGIQDVREESKIIQSILSRENLQLLNLIRNLVQGNLEVMMVHFSSYHHSKSSMKFNQGWKLDRMLDQMFIDNSGTDMQILKAVYWKSFGAIIV